MSDEHEKSYAEQLEEAAEELKKASAEVNLDKMNELLSLIESHQDTADTYEGTEFFMALTFDDEDRPYRRDIIDMIVDRFQDYGLARVKIVASTPCRIAYNGTNHPDITYAGAVQPEIQFDPPGQPGPPLSD